MSAFGDNVRRISKYQELLEMIRQLSTKVEQSAGTAVPTTRGVAYSDSITARSSGGSNSDNGGVFEKAKDIAGDIGEKAGENVVKDGEAPRTGGGGVTDSGSADDIGSGDNTQKDGWYDAESILNKSKDSWGKSPPETASGIIIKTLTGLKSGARDMIIHMTDPALSMLAPNDWESNFVPGDDTEWLSIYFWQASGAYNFSGVTGSTPNTCAQAAASGVVGYYNAGNNSTVTAATVAERTGAGPSTYTIYIDMVFTNVSSGAITTAHYPLDVSRVGCSGVGSPSLSCTSSAPSKPFSFDLGVTQLALLSSVGLLLIPTNLSQVGQFIPHPADTNVPDAYKNGASILDLETSVGTDVRIGLLGDGGWYMYNRDPSNSNLPIGAATENSVYTVGNGNEPKGWITPNELATRLPR